MSDVRTDSNLTAAEARQRALLIDNVSYRIVLDLTQGDSSFGSESSVRFNCKQPGESTFVDLLARSVRSASLNGEEIDPSTYDGLRIKLDDLQETNELVVDAECAFTRAGVGLHWFKDPADDLVYIYSDLEPFEAHRAFACFDQPDLKATFDFEVEAPSGWVVVSNMKPSKRSAAEETGRWTFETTPRISTYITAICAGPYAEFKDALGDVELGLYCRQSMAKYLDPENIFEITRGGFDYFNEKFDFPYMTNKYDHVFCPEYNQGAMENLGCVTVTETYIFRSKVTGSTLERRAETILHELAHMWFGDLVTMRWWEDLWLNESFATYESIMSQMATTEFTEGWTTFANGWKTWAYREDQLPGTHPITTEMPDTDSVRVNFDGIAYAKGCSVLRQLVAWVGEDAFKEGLRDYFKTHQYGNAELADFLSALEKASGRELGSWAKEWLQTAGVNTITPRFAFEGDKISSFVLEQTAAPEHPTIRSHRIAIGLYDDSGGKLKRTKLVEIDASGTETEVPELSGVPRPALVLPNDNDLTFAKIRLDPQSLSVIRDRVCEIDRPLSRAVCWAAAWDMTRDGEMKARDYITMVERNLGRESQITVIEWTWLKTYHTLAFFVDPAAQVSTIEGYTRYAYDQATTVEPGSDFQLAWTKAFASTAITDEQLDLVQDLLDGTGPIPGCQVDSELRWHLIQALAASGRVDESRIAEELDTDATETGQRSADIAR
ncbi:MAG TPA: aminopeptidase N, partial [Actinomycetota bacterium]|nr:aminopeptidase N [Actinomycetota bacterium]